MTHHAPTPSCGPADSTGTGGFNGDAAEGAC